jgi:hypothetical protein
MFQSFLSLPLRVVKGGSSIFLLRFDGILMIGKRRRKKKKKKKKGTFINNNNNNKKPHDLKRRYGNGTS